METPRAVDKNDIQTTKCRHFMDSPRVKLDDARRQFARQESPHFSQLTNRQPSFDFRRHGGHYWKKERPCTQRRELTAWDRVPETGFAPDIKNLKDPWEYSG